MLIFPPTNNIHPIASEWKVQSSFQTGTWAYHQKMYGPDFPYQNFAPQFRAELFDPDHWAEVFARSGAKYVVLTSKHHEGFALWPSKEASATWGQPWNAVEIGPRRDVLGDLTNAVRRKGLRMGYYYSLYEWYNPLWLSDKPRYIREHLFPQFKDLITRYQPSIIFSDGEWDLDSAEWRTPELLAWLFNESPVKAEVVINDRWGKDCRHKHGGYWTTEYTPGMTGMDHPWEESRGMGFSYGYNRAERLEHYHTGRELVIMLADLVSRGGKLLPQVNVAESHVLRLQAAEQVKGILGTLADKWLPTAHLGAGNTEMAKEELVASRPLLKSPIELVELLGEGMRGVGVRCRVSGNREGTRGADVRCQVLRWQGKDRRQIYQDACYGVLRLSRDHQSQSKDLSRHTMRGVNQ